MNLIISIHIYLCSRVTFYQNTCARGDFDLFHTTFHVAKNKMVIRGCSNSVLGFSKDSYYSCVFDMKVP